MSEVVFHTSCLAATHCVRRMTELFEEGGRLTSIVRRQLSGMTDA
jgi:hypothetical protein